MRGDGFKLEIFTPEKADVYVACPAGAPVLWPIVGRLDQLYIRAVTDVLDSEPDQQRVRRIMSACSGLVVVLPYRASEVCTTIPTFADHVRVAAELGIPVLIFREQGVRAAACESVNKSGLRFGSSASIAIGLGQVWGPVLYSEEGDFCQESLAVFEQFMTAVLRARASLRPYAFFIGRLERDFTHARDAIRVAVEAEAGVPCLWSDDCRHTINIESVRERTRLLIKHAAFVIADLTLGPENPERENPSRAHEIGMTIAYGRKLILFSQEPRRYPYFSIGDMQMTFWSTESDLGCKLREWISTNRESLARTVLNHSLENTDTNLEPKIKRPNFTYDVAQRFIGPKTKVVPSQSAPILALSAGSIYLVLVYFATTYFSLGSRAYWIAFIVLIFMIFEWSQLTGRARGVSKSARVVAQFLVLTALTLMTFALTATKAP
jgi:hypothetical protein